MQWTKTTKIVQRMASDIVSEASAAMKSGPFIIGTDGSSD